jgi:hypothetical protein
MATTKTFWASAAEQHDSWLGDVAGVTCRECGSKPGQCYRICSHSEHYYSAEQEYEDTMRNESMSQSEWMSAAVAQYESVHGKDSYCS